MESPEDKARESRIWMMLGGAAFFVVLVVLFFVLASGRLHRDVRDSAQPGGSGSGAASQTAH